MQTEAFATALGKTLDQFLTVQGKARQAAERSGKAAIDSIGDHNPIHQDHEYAASTRFEKPIVPGMWTAALISTVLGTKLPGPGCIYVGQPDRVHPARGRDEVKRRFLDTAAVLASASSEGGDIMNPPGACG